MGTVGYMSPEQVRGQTADPRSDIFAFGAILYEMISGKRAFHGETSADTMSAILKEETPELSETARNVPPGLERIVRHCLEKSSFAAFPFGGRSGIRSGSADRNFRHQTSRARRRRCSKSKARSRAANWLSVAGAIALAALADWFGLVAGTRPRRRPSARVSADYIPHRFDRQRALRSRRQHRLRRVLGRRCTPTLSGSHRRQRFARTGIEECRPCFRSRRAESWQSGSTPFFTAAMRGSERWRRFL